ncbi:MAG: hypothetical protein ACSLFK_16680, partial [Gemmatimonadaceae bacterium]
MKPLSLSEPARVTTSVKAHLVDGSTIVYPHGVTVDAGNLVGVGTRYDLTLTEVGPVHQVPLDSVVALEAFENTAQREMTVLASGLTTVGVIVAAAALAFAIFGSCPTVYTDVDGAEELEAELFSVAIAPLLEVTDVDRLRVQPNAEGVIEFHVRNEALETHYINHLAVLEVRHAADEMIVPDSEGRPLALRKLEAPAEVVDRRGRDLAAILALPDDHAFRTDAQTLSAVTRNDFSDAIEVRLPVPENSEEVALVLRLRNSLLSTVLFYETILKRSGARSLDWLSRDLANPSVASELAEWYSSRMGMRVEVWREGSYREVARIRDSGPIAWKTVAVAVPVLENEAELRIRLSFVADNRRIDQLRFAGGVRRPEMRKIPAA